MAGRLRLDPRTRVLDGGRTLLGGDPPRALRLSDPGAAAVRALVDERRSSSPGGNAAASAEAAWPPAAGTVSLAARLVDAGLAHPIPDLARGAALAGSVTLVVPVRDRVAELTRCLDAVVRCADRPGRVLVVDDGSRDPDAIADVATAHGATLIRRATAGGPAVARNAALSDIDGDLVAFLDSDCVPEPGWLARLCAVLDGDNRLAAVGARVRPLTAPDGGAPHGGDETKAGSARPGCRTPFARFAAVRSPLDLGARAASVRPGARVAYLPTAALLARRAALRDGFDPALRYGEDVDLVWRMLDAGHRVRYEPSAVVAHGEPDRVGRWLARRFAYGTSAGPLARRRAHSRGRLAPAVVHLRLAPALGLALAGHPVSAAAALAPLSAANARKLGRLGVPARVAVAETGRGAVESGAALGRAATMLAWPGLALAAVRGGRSTRRGVLLVVVVSPLREYARARPALDPARWIALSIADDIAYGAGVWVGALRARTLAPLRPRVIR